jgi:hypothetical protein
LSALLCVSICTFVLVKASKVSTCFQLARKLPCPRTRRLIRRQSTTKRLVVLLVPLFFFWLQNLLSSCARERLSHWVPRSADGACGTRSR